MSIITLRVNGAAHTVDVEDATTPGLLDTLRQGAAKGLGHMSVSGLVLVKDLRETYIAAHRAEIGWIVLQQAAKAARDTELLAVVGVYRLAARFAGLGGHDFHLMVHPMAKVAASFGFFPSVKAVNASRRKCSLTNVGFCQLSSILPV